MQIKPFLYFPVKQPIDKQNLFGTVSPMYTSTGQKGHPGIDFECISGTPVYSPCDGAAMYVTDKDGGCGIWIRYPNNLPDVEYTIILWHMYNKDIGNPNNLPGFPYDIPTDGTLTQVKAGQLLGYSDNSGFPIESTGPHLHIGIIPCDKTGAAMDPDNGYLGCVDPIPYFNDLYAEDISNQPSVPTQQIVDTVRKTVDAITIDNIPVSQKKTFLQELEDLLLKYL